MVSTEVRPAPSFSYRDAGLPALMLISLIAGIALGYATGSILCGLFAGLGTCIACVDDESEFDVSLWRLGVLAAVTLGALAYWGIPSLWPVSIFAFIWACKRMLFCEDDGC
jgi:hypothetical protein